MTVDVTSPTVPRPARAAIAFDDFGTGWSSLECLFGKPLPADEFRRLFDE